MTANRFLLFLIIIPMIVVAGCKIGPKKELTSKDIPLGVGTSYESYANISEGPINVSFNNDGPWDFSKGPKEGVVKSKLIKKEKAPEYKRFPRAQVVEQVLPSDFTRGFSIYNFIDSTDEKLVSYGQNWSPKETYGKVLLFEEPERLLKFPLKVGDSWTDKLKIQGEGKVSQVVEKEVVSRGQVVVPAGTFHNCFMVRIKRTVKADVGGDSWTIMYMWWAPDIGPVAVINSQVGEKSNIFKQADYFSRLKKYKIAK